ncbi:MAG: hypothetical protein AAF366_14155 [Pseudomonadota bacterium]
MRNIYTAKPRGRLLDRLALISALTLAGIVTVDLVFYKDIVGFDRTDVTDVVDAAETGD